MIGIGQRYRFKGDAVLTIKVIEPYTELVNGKFETIAYKIYDEYMKIEYKMYESDFEDFELLK